MDLYLKPEISNSAVAVLVSLHVYNYMKSLRLPNDPLLFTFIFSHVCDKLRNMILFYTVCILFSPERKYIISFIYEGCSKAQHCVRFGEKALFEIFKNIAVISKDSLCRAMHRCNYCLSYSALQ